MEFTFTGTIPAGDQIFHHFTVTQGGGIIASVQWEAVQVVQTVCMIRSDYADYPATCAPAASGRTNTVTISADSGRRYTVYAVPDRREDAPYTIRVLVE